MKVRKAIKKIVALGVGATMVGATLLGAAATDLGKFPGMFIGADGSFDALFVAGANAAGTDVIGMSAIAAAVQSEAVNKVWVPTGGGETTFSAVDGVFLSTGSDVFRLGNTVNDVDSSLDDGDLPDLLVSGVIEDTDYDDEEYEYDQDITIDTGIEVAFDNPSDDDNGIIPVSLLEFSGVAVTYTVDFDDSDVVFGKSDGGDAEEGFQNSESIVMLGTKYTFKAGLQHDSDEITLYKSSVLETIGLGESIEVEMNDETYVVELIAINSDSADAKVTLMVNGVSKTMEEGDQDTIAGLAINVDDIQINTIGDQFGFVRVYLGADELVLDVDTGDVELNGEEIDGVEFVIGANLSSVSSMSFEFTPEDFDLDPDLDELQVGEYFVDPLFGVIKFQFVGPELNEILESEDVFEIDGTSNELDINFVDVDGNDVVFTLFEYDDGTNNISLYDGDYAVHKSVFDGTTDLEDIGEDVAFILSDEDVITDEDAVSTILVVDKINYDTDDSESYARFENLNTGHKFEVKTGDEILETNRFVQVGVGDFINITMSDGTTLEAGENDLRTLNGIVLTLSANVTNSSDVSDVGIVFSEEDAVWDDADYTAVDVTFTITGDSSDDEFNIAVNNSASWITGAKSMDDYDYYMSEIGTYGVIDVEDDNKVTMYTPSALVQYNVWVGPAGTAGESSVTGNGYWQTEVVPIPNTAFVRDTAVTAPLTKNLIVVGGPCANSVASALMGNPENCVEGFTPGKAKIKLFENNDAVAVLVAGFTAEDTERATTVMANFKDYASTLDGMTEVEVTGTSMTDISVGLPTMEDEVDEETTEEDLEDVVDDVEEIIDDLE